MRKEIKEILSGKAKEVQKDIISMIGIS